jgi:hypothetical protein
MGFRNVAAYAAAPDMGAHQIGMFRKLPAAGLSSFWADLSMAPGTPVPNYYASAPLVAARLDAERGLFHGAPVAPAKKHLRNVVLMTSTAAIGVAQYVLCDYLLYYPFIDMDAAGEEQVMDNAVALPRYSDGAGVRAFMVTLAPSIGGGQFFVTYTNQDGATGRQTPVQFCPAASQIGGLVATTQNAGGHKPFIDLAPGDTGMRAIESVTFLSAQGGLAALVLCRPLATIVTREAGTPREVESIKDVPISATVEDGAYLNFLVGTPLGALGGSTIAGYAEFVWG